MAKAGRPPGGGERFPCGKLKPNTDGMSGVLWQRLKKQGAQLGLDARLTSEVGRLNWFGELTLAQTVAALRVASVYGRYERLAGLNRSTRSPSYERSYGSVGVDEERLSRTVEGRDTLELMHDMMRDAERDFFALRDSIDVALRGDLEGLCVEDRAISPARYELVREQLERLAQTWKIKRGEKKDNTGARGPKREGPSAPLPNLDRIFWMEVARKLRPDLGDDQLGEAYDVQQALKARELVRRAARGKKAKVIQLPTARSPNAAKPTLTINAVISPE